MLMMSTNIIFGVLLALYTSVGSATPTGVTNLNTLGLVPRAPPQINMCHAPMVWESRECDRTRNDIRAWVDVCRSPLLTFREPGPGCGASPPTMCQNVIEPDGTRTIECAPMLTPGMLLTRKRKRDPQGGSSPKKMARVSPQTTVVSHPVTVVDDMTASVTGVVFGPTDTFVLGLSSPVVGTRHDGTKVCEGDRNDKTKAMECIPKGRFALRAGEVITFEWGMVHSQVGSLKYLLWQGD